MDTPLELIVDGDDLAVIGQEADVEAFVATLNSPSRDLGLPRLSRLLAAGAGASEAVSRAALSPGADAGRWVRLTEESARKVHELGLTPTKTPGVSHAMIGRPGASKSWLQLDKGPGQLPTNPTLLAGAPALMAQLAMQQAMEEIADYLATIDAKLDDVLRAQKDSVLAQMIGVGLQIEEAMTIRRHTGRVNEVTWSKVQSAAGTIADTQAYALLQLEALAEKLANRSSIAELVKTAEDVEVRVREWLAVLARCVQLQDGIAVLELDRVLETDPDDLTNHKVGLHAARTERLDAITRTTELLLARINEATVRANSRVLFNPHQSPAVVRSGAAVNTSVAALHERLGIEGSGSVLEARRWRSAVTEAGNAARTRGKNAATAGNRLARDTGQRAASSAERIRGRLSDRRKPPATDADTPTE